ncbi:hypothetical protein PR048_006945 [Dryococelus australis]|uniref:Uncharacterized protein n=1 Tax=Dryococelus australis TaxID=614101 RepID=A0ABQ9IDP4_9NEOP|nr:hypothetical protein PR048_006945 [Dryococelus australis]
MELTLPSAITSAGTPATTMSTIQAPELSSMKGQPPALATGVAVPPAVTQASLHVQLLPVTPDGPQTVSKEGGGGEFDVCHVPPPLRPFVQPSPATSLQLGCALFRRVKCAPVSQRDNVQTKCKVTSYTGEASFTVSVSPNTDLKHQCSSLLSGGNGWRVAASPAVWVCPTPAWKGIFSQPDTSDISILTSEAMPKNVRMFIEAAATPSSITFLVKTRVAWLGTSKPPRPAKQRSRAELPCGAALQVTDLQRYAQSATAKLRGRERERAREVLSQPELAHSALKHNAFELEENGQNFSTNFEATTVDLCTCARARYTGGDEYLSVAGVGWLYSRAVRSCARGLPQWLLGKARDWTCRRRPTGKDDLPGTTQLWTRAAVAEQLAYSSPPKANFVQSPAGSLLDYRMWESFRTMPLFEGFSRGSPVSPDTSFRCYSILSSITLIGSQTSLLRATQIPSLTHFNKDYEHAKMTQPKTVNFCHSARQRRRSRVHCSLRSLWFLDNGSRRNGMRVISAARIRRRRTVDADRFSPVAVLQCQANTVDEAVRSVTAMRTRWRLSLAVVTLRGPVPARHCVRPSSIRWFHTHITVVALYEPKCHDTTTRFPGTDIPALLELTHMLRWHPLISVASRLHKKQDAGEANVESDGKVKRLKSFESREGLAGLPEVPAARPPCSSTSTTALCTARVTHGGAGDEEMPLRSASAPNTSVTPSYRTHTHTHTHKHTCEYSVLPQNRSTTQRRNGMERLWGRTTSLTGHYVLPKLAERTAVSLTHTLLLPTHSNAGFTITRQSDKNIPDTDEIFSSPNEEPGHPDKRSPDQTVSLLASHQGEQGSISGRVTREFRKWKSCRIMPLVSGFSLGYPVPPALSFRRCSTQSPSLATDLHICSSAGVEYERQSSCKTFYNVGSRLGSKNLFPAKAVDMGARGLNLDHTIIPYDNGDKHYLDPRMLIVTIPRTCDWPRRVRACLPAMGPELRRLAP